MAICKSYSKVWFSLLNIISIVELNFMALSQCALTYYLYVGEKHVYTNFYRLVEDIILNFSQLKFWKAAELFMTWFIFIKHNVLVCLLIWYYSFICS